MIEEVRLCIDPSCARRAAGDLLLCWADRDRLARLLDPANVGGPDASRPHLGHQPGGIAEMYRTAVEGHGWCGETEHEHAEAARVDDRAIALRDVRSSATGPGRDDDGTRGPRSVLATLGGWARIVHEERGDPLPQLARPGWTGVRRPHPTSDPDRMPGWMVHRVPRAIPMPDVQAVTTLCRWLHARIDWACTQPWIDDLAAELREVAAQLRAAAGERGGRYLGPCPATIDPDTGQLNPLAGTMCGAPLYAPTAGARDPGPIDLPSIRCDRCGGRYSGTALLDLARDRGLVDGVLDGGPRCPVHDLPPERLVTIRVLGTLLDGTAAEVCRTWHQDYERAG